MKRMPDVVAISETKLNASSVSNINFDYYKFFHNDSVTCAGGVGLYVRETLKFQLPDDLLLHLQNCEDLWLEIESKETNFILGVIYRHPKQKLSLFNDKLCDTLSLLESNKVNYIVCGDTNINLLAKYNPKIKNYVNDLKSIGSKLLIDIPTRFPVNCRSSLLDHIYTNITKQSIKSGVCIYEVSDHLPTFVIAKNTKCFSEKKIKFKRLMKHFILEDFLKDLDNKLSTYSIKLFDEKNVNQDVLN